MHFLSGGATFPAHLVDDRTPTEGGKGSVEELESDVLGFDTETKPNFKRGHLQIRWHFAIGSLAWWCFFGSIWEARL